MKPKLTIIAMVLLVASSSMGIAQVSEPSSTQTSEVEKAEPKEVPKPKPYPLETCLVSGDGLDEMDDRVAMVYEGQTFEFCCKPCIAKFKKNPEKYVAKLAAAVKR